MRDAAGMRRRFGIVGARTMPITKCRTLHQYGAGLLPPEAVGLVQLGRKNYLFMGSDGGGKAAAIAFALIETAKLNSGDP